MKLKKIEGIKFEPKITYYLNPDYIYIPYKKLDLKQNEIVYKKMVIDDKLSSVSGKVIGIKRCNINNKLSKMVVIENDYRELEVGDKEKTRITVKNLLNALKNNKELFDKFKSSKDYDNIVIKAFDFEPYTYNQIYLLKENISELLEFYHKLLTLYKCSKNYLVVHNNDTIFIDECLNVLGTYPEIKLSLVNDDYMYQDDFYLFKTLNIKGNTLCLTASELLYIYSLFNGGVKSTKLITISGDAIKISKVLRVKKYCDLKNIIEKYIDIIDDNYEIVINGLMKGEKIKKIDELIITDEVESIHFMKKKEVITSECINCGKCLKVCPYKVNPVTLKNKELCTHCGLCTYVCPCFINLKERLKK